MTTAYLNRIAGAVPPHDVHAAFLHFAELLLLDDHCRAALFRRMASWAGIEHRYSLLSPADDPEGTALDTAGLYVRGKFPTTAVRMRFFEAHAPKLAAAAVERLELDDERDGITHLLITSCTGFSAPGLDLEVIERCRLPISVERTIVGFMGCYAALNALKLARHIVRSEPKARVLIVNLELCTLHLHETTDLEEILSFLLWGDGCAASLVTAKPTGLALEAFQSTVLPEPATCSSGISGISASIWCLLAKSLRPSMRACALMSTRCSEARRPAPSTCGRCIPAAGPLSMRSNGRLISHRRHCWPPARC